MKKLAYLLLLAPFVSCKKSEVGQTGSETFPTDSVVYFRDNPSGGIYVINEVRANQMRLALTAANPVVVTSPNWGPDGKIYFIAKFESDSLMQAYSMNADGSGVTHLTNEQGVLHDELHVSPKGKRALFQKIYNSPYAGTYTINLDGTGEHYACGYLLTPSWHPDGNRIIYINNYDTNADGQNVSNIFSMNYDGSGIMRITHNTDVNRQLYYPFVSPDGTKIAFTATTSQNSVSAEVYTVSMDGSNEQKILAAQEGERWSNRNWSKDGRFILINDINANLLLLKADGSSKRQIAWGNFQAAMIKDF